MDPVSLASAVVSAQFGQLANERQIAVAANAARAQQATVDVLLQAIQSSSYGANGRVGPGAVAGTRFAASA